MKIEVSERKSVFAKLDSAWHKDIDFIEVTQWTNGEGWDVQISEHENFQLHFKEWELLKKLIKHIEK
jgi:hypothetical protein